MKTLALRFSCVILGLHGLGCLSSLKYISLPFFFLSATPSVRKQHNAGYKHKANVRTYYQQFEAQQNQSLIDQKIKEHLGQTTAYQQVGAAYNALRPRVPILPTPMMPMAGNTQLPVNSPLIPGARPPVLPRPLPDWAGMDRTICLGPTMNIYTYRCWYAYSLVIFIAYNTHMLGALQCNTVWTVDQH
ncbi:hypothetical protein CsSME_00047223 [Camellia sinensis var. sinensis]